MKKFIKYAAIIGCILILVGAGIATASFSLGGNPFRAVDDIEERFENYSETKVEYGPAAGYYETTVAATAEAEHETVIAQDTTELVMDKLTDVEISIENGEVIVHTESDREQALLISENGNLNHVDYRNMEQFQKLEIHAKKGEQYVLILPETWKLSDFDVECAGGTFDGDGVRANEVEISVRGGNAGMVQRNGGNVSLECTGGAIQWTADGYLPTQVDAECTGGDINLYIADEVDSEKVGYEIEYAGGSIDFFGRSYDGTGADRRNATGGMPYFDLEIAGGSITVQ